MDSVKDPKDKKTKSQPSAQNKQANTEPSLHLSSSSSQQGYSLYSQHYLKQMKTQNQSPSLNEWFSQLLNHEKAIALTIVDPDVVNLIQSMHSRYLDWGHGHYGTQKEPRDRNSLDRVERVGDYNLWFRRRKCPGALGGASSASRTYGDNLTGAPYDYYGFQPYHHGSYLDRTAESKTIKEREKSEDCLLSEMRIVKIGNEPALTVSNYLLENTSFFLAQMRKIDPNFLLGDLKVERTDNKMAMSKSVFCKDRAKDDPKSAQDGRASHGNNTAASRKQGGRGK